MKLFLLLAFASCQAPAARDWVVLEGSGSVLGLPGDFHLDIGPGCAGRLRTGTALGEEIVSDGARVWVRSWNNPVRELNLAERESALVQFAVLAGAWDETDGPVLAARAGDNWELRLRDGRAVFQLEVDPATGDPLRLTRHDTGGTEGIALEQWRDFGGLRAPGLIRRGSLNGVHDEFTIATARRGMAPQLGAPASAAADFSFDPAVSARLEARRARTGHILVRPRVDGADLGWFIFDSGAGALCLDPDAAESLGYEPFGQVTAVGVAGHADTGFFRTKSLTLGPLTLREPIFISLDLNFIGVALGENIAGIVGYEVFARSVVEFQAGSTPELSLHPRDSYTLDAGAAWQPLILDGTVPCVRSRFEGDREGLFRLDTGAGDSVSFHSPAVARWHLLEGRATGTTLAGGVGGIKAIKNGDLEWFELGGRRFEAVKAQFCTEQEGAFSDEDLDGNVGLGLLGKFRMIFDYGGSRLAFADRS